MVDFHHYPIKKIITFSELKIISVYQLVTTIELKTCILISITLLQGPSA